MQLSKNFYLSEFLESQTARRHGISEQFNPSKEVVENLRLLCVNVLQPLRDKSGSIKISSGYRCKRVNDIVKGSATSEHMTGQAADIQGLQMSNSELFKLIQALKLPFNQLIWEFGTKQSPAWVHVSFNKSLNKKQILYIGV
jgi:zinc D-Ala-D-Ala carboxypeptidase